MVLEDSFRFSYQDDNEAFYNECIRKRLVRVQYPKQLKRDFVGSVKCCTYVVKVRAADTKSKATDESSWLLTVNKVTATSRHHIGC